jgi:hypothetical protein
MHHPLNYPQKKKNIPKSTLSLTEASIGHTHPATLSHTCTTPIQTSSHVLFLSSQNISEQGLNMCLEGLLVLVLSLHGLLGLLGLLVYRILFFDPDA